MEVAGGLYHLITRGNNRQEIFHEAGDYQKFLSLLEIQKSRLPFFLYAYCLMSNRSSVARTAGGPDWPHHASKC